MLAPFYRLNENETKKSYGTVGSNFESSYLIIAKKFVCMERIELLFVTRISLDSHSLDICPVSTRKTEACPTEKKN